MTTLAVRWSKARSEHTCSSCGCPIYDGERFHREAIKEGNTVYNFYEHMYCRRAISELLANESRTFEDRPVISELTDDDFRVLLSLCAETYHELGVILGRTPGCNVLEYDEGIPF